MNAIRKYPRTPHLEGSRLQPGDHDLGQVPFRDLHGRRLVVSEKLDGANSGLSFDDGAELHLQSRGHHLTGGPREKHFNLFKQWANTHAHALFEALGPGRILYGEWMYAKHTIYYDRLPHYFVAYDILDPRTGHFLGIDDLRAILAGTPAFVLPPLHVGPIASLDQFLGLIGPSAYKSPVWRDRLAKEAASRGLDVVLVLRETDDSDFMEGLYINVEEDGRVVERYKWVRAEFHQAIVDSETHWLRRPNVPNALADESSLHALHPARA